MLAENMHFFIAYFLGEISKFGIETLHTMRDNHLFIGSNLLFLKQNLAYSIILPPKNGGLKAWSHGVRKANWLDSLFTLKVRNSICLNTPGTK